MLTASRSRRGPARSPRCWAPTGPARRRCCARSAGSSGRGSGRIVVGGANLARRPPEDIARAGVAHVPEGQGVITELTVEENLRLGALSRRGGSVRAAALADTYERFPLLAERRRRPAGTLSGGERQILVIARALMAAPQVLLLDEPSLGLAPRIVAQIMGLVRQLRDDSGPDRPAGRAERPQRAGHRRPRDRAQPRQDRRRGRCRRRSPPTSRCAVTTWASRRAARCRSSSSSPSAGSASA